MIPIFVGFDPREAVAYHVFCQSVLERTKEEVSFTPISGEQRDATNRFSHERWGIPARQGFRGWAIYAECDMLARAPLDELWAPRHSDYDVMVAQHDYQTKHPVKYWGQPNEDYPRKNWSSLMLINCAAAVWQRIPMLSPGPSIQDLHRFSPIFPHGGRQAEGFATERVGALPLEWNWLVGEYEHNPDAKLVHFTIGGPYFDAYRNCHYADEWRATRDRMLYAKPYTVSEAAAAR